MPGAPPGLGLSSSASHSHKRHILKDRSARLLVEDQGDAFVGKPEFHPFQACGIQGFLDFALTFWQAVEEQETGTAKSRGPSPIGARPTSHFIPLLHPCVSDPATQLPAGPPALVEQGTDIVEIATTKHPPKLGRPSFDVVESCHHTRSIAFH